MPWSCCVSPSDVVVRSRQVGRTFAPPSGPVVALDGVDLEVAASGLTVLTGPSGCGKTTLLHLLVGADVADTGVVEIDGRDVARFDRRAWRRLRRRDLGVALARPSDNLVDRLDVDANVRLASRLRRERPDVDAVLDRVGLARHRRARIDALSGGEQQRLAIAIALVGAPRIVVLDEPTSELDRVTGEAIVTRLREHATAHAVVVASHDPVVVRAADTLVTLDRGRRVA
jgi:ABC-type lipoprotein export system ATPase subunit